MASSAVCQGGTPGGRLLAPVCGLFDSLLASLPQEDVPQNPQHYEIVRDLADLDRLIEQLRKAGSFALDTETTSLDSMHAQLVGISVCSENGTASINRIE